MGDVQDDVDLYKRALQQIATGDLAAAAESVRAAIDRNGDVAWYHHTLGEVYERQGHWAPALTAYRSALRLNPMSSKYRQAMARVSAQQSIAPQGVPSLRAVDAPPGRSARTKEKPRLLVVEDSEVVRSWYERILRGEYQLSFATTARGAMRALPVVRPVLVVLDWQLDEGSPEPSGLETLEESELGDSASGLDVCRQIRRSAYRHVPVLMLTSKKGLINKTGAKLARVDRFLTKPVSAEVLQTAIRELLAEARQPSLQGQHL